MFWRKYANWSSIRLSSRPMNVNEMPFLWQVLAKVLDSIYLFQGPRLQYFHRDSAPEIDLSKLHMLYTWCTLGSES